MCLNELLASFGELVAEKCCFMNNHLIINAVKYMGFNFMLLSQFKFAVLYTPL